MSEEEQFLIRTTGGPHDGETRLVPLSVLGHWPPPLTLPGKSRGGVYVRSTYSNLPDGVSNETLKRGADYEWLEDGQ